MKDTSYLETFYEVVEFITLNFDNSRGVLDVESTRGRGGLYELAEDLTDEFQEINKDREWDGEFFDEIDEFLHEKLMN